MPLYHATWDHHLESIAKHGLGGARPDKRNFDCVPGLYLSRSPEVAISFLIEAMIENGDDSRSPAAYLDSMRLIVIDSSRIDIDKISNDPEIERTDLTVFYNGVIDITGLRILTVDEVIPPARSPLP